MKLRRDAAGHAGRDASRGEGMHHCRPADGLLRKLAAVAAAIGVNVACREVYNAPINVLRELMGSHAHRALYVAGTKSGWGHYCLVYLDWVYCTREKASGAIDGTGGERSFAKERQAMPS